MSGAKSSWRGLETGKVQPVEIVRRVHIREPPAVQFHDPHIELVDRIPKLKTTFSAKHLSKTGSADVRYAPGSGPV